MKFLIKLFLVFTSIGIALFSLSGCLPPLPPLPTIQPTGTFPTFTPIPQPGATITPTVEPTSGPNSLQLGQPFWIGRGQILDAVFLPGAKQVAIAWSSGVSLDSVETGQELWFQPTPTNVTAFDLQPQAQMLAAALADGSVMLFDLVGSPPQQFKASQPDAYSGDLAWSPDGKTVAFQFVSPAGSDPIYLLDPTSGRISHLPDSTRVAAGVVPMLAWSPDGSMLTVAGLGDVCPRLVDAHTGADRMSLGSPGGCYSDLPLAWLPGGKLLAVPWLSEGAALLNYPEGSVARYLWSPLGIGVSPGAKRALFTDPAGKWIATRGGIGLYGYDNHQPFLVWDLTSGAVAGQILQALKPLESIPRMAATFDGNNILILYQNGQITRLAFTDPAAVEQRTAQILTMPPAPYTIRWSADGSRLAFSGRYGGVELWDPANKGQLVHHFDAPLEAPALNADGSKVALLDPVKNVETIYDAASGSPVRSLENAGLVLLGPAFSRDGRYLAYASAGRPRVADLSSIQVVTLEPDPADGVSPGMAVTRLIWAPDGLALVTAFGIPGSEAVGSGMIVLWKRGPDGTFQEVYHAANVQAGDEQSYLPLAIFNPSGSRVALQAYAELGTAQGQMLVIYDLAAQKAILTLPMTTAGAWVSADVLLLGSTATSGRLERINVVTGNRTSGSGLDHVNAYDPTANYYMHEALTNARGIVILQWQESDNTKIAARGIFETNGLAGYGWSPDGRWAFAIGNDGSFRIWPVVKNQD